MAHDDWMARISAVQTKYTDQLMRLPNVVGVAIGLSQETGEPTLIVLVSKKVPQETLAPDERIPRELDGVRVEVQEIGEIWAL